MLKSPAKFRLCDGRRMAHRWINAGGGFGCPVNHRYSVYKGIHTHRMRNANFVCRLDGHKRTMRAEFYLRMATRLAR